MVIDTLARSGMAALFGGPAPTSADRRPRGDRESSRRQGFVAVRMLAEREGLRFVEAVKKNS